MVAFIQDVARYWLDQGIDGWRLDVPFCFGDDEFWQAFRQVVKSCNPEAYISGEIPFDATRWLKGDQFDGVMNYLFSYACWGFLAAKFSIKPPSDTGFSTALTCSATKPRISPDR